MYWYCEHLMTALPRRKHEFLVEIDNTGHLLGSDGFPTYESYEPGCILPHDFCDELV